MIVFASGVFDTLHCGHLDLLRFARSRGTYLIVGINSDDSVRRIKGPSRPIIPQDQREKLLRAIRYVDEVRVFDDDTPVNILCEIRPDVIVKGSDWEDKYMPEREVVGYWDGRLVFFHHATQVSTTSIISRCAERIAS